MADPTPEPTPSPTPSPAPSPAPSAAPSPSPEPTDWRASLPEDLREPAKNFKQPADAVKSARDLRAKLSNALTIPGEKATDEERAEFQNKLKTVLGVPDSPEKYTFKNPEKLPEGIDPEAVKKVQTAFAKKMHEAGVPPSAAQAAIDFIWETRDSADAELATARIEANKVAESQLRKAWGGDFDANLALSRRAIMDYGGAELAEFLNKTGLGNNLALANAFRDLGAYRSEDGMVGGTTSEEMKSLEKQAEEKMLDPAYRNPGDPKFAKLHEEVAAIYGRMYPSGSIGPGT